MHDADDAIARLLRRSCVPGAASLVSAATATASAKLRQQGGVELRSATRRLLAVTDARALQRECLETEKIVHSEDTSASSSQLLVFHEQVTGVVGLDEIDALRDELCGLQATKELSLEEEAYAEELEAVIVEALADAFVSGIISHDDTRRARHGDRPDDAQLWLLELAVQPSPMTRQLAFSLLLQVGISSTSILLSTMIDSSRNALRYDISKLQDELFATLREMLAKAVVVAGTASASPTHRQTRRSARATVYGELSWVEAALECIVLFTKHIDGDKGFRRDRLSQLDPLALRYLFEAVALGLPDTACAQESIVELIIVTIYTSEPRSMIASTSAPGSRSALRVSPTAFEQCCSLELLLAMLYTTVSVHTQQLLFMVLFDLACEQLFKSKNTAAPVCKDPDLLWLALLEQELPSRWLRSPLTFSSTSTPRVAKVLATAHPSLFDKSTLAVLMQLHRFLRINEYFERSVSLSSMLQVAQESSSQTDTIMRKIDELLSSCRATEKFRGELWLSELLTFGVTPSTGGSSPRGAILNGAAGCEGGGRDGTKLQETCGFSNNDKVRCAAQDKLWNLIGDLSLPAERMSFARVVTLFVRRLLHSKVATSPAIIELRSCLDAVVKQQVTNKEVVATLMLLILDVCQTSEMTHADQRRLAFDRTTTEPTTLASDALAPSVIDFPTPDDQSETPRVAASRFLRGNISLDEDLLEALGPGFFFHAAQALTVHELSRDHACRGSCCGSTRSAANDAGVCAAFILFHLCESNDAALPRIGGLSSTTMFLGACETRVAVLAARFLHRQIKRRDSTKYFALLRELSAACADRDDGDTLTNSLLHVRAILESGGVGIES